MTCTYCKAENAEDCMFCPNCGKPASGSREALPPLINTPVKQEVVVSASAGSRINPVSADMPGPQNAQLAQANLRRLRKNWAEATDLCIAVLREDPADPAAHSVLGDIYRDQNRLDEAVRWYRMALELSPNPFDKANLQKLEKQISRRSLAYGSDSSGADTQSPLSPTGSLTGGTASLMGIPPQKWLRGITITALGFLCLFIIYLLALPTKKISPVPRAIDSEALVSVAGNGSNDLPPARLGGPATLPAGEQPTSNGNVGRVAGTGLAPDLGSGTTQPIQQQTGPAGSVGAGLGPAPVREVSPMTGAISGTGQVGLMTSNQARSGIHPNSLTGGIQPGPVEAGRGSATIQLIASSASTPRDVLVRNLFREARTVFSNDTTLQRATVTIHSESADGAQLLSADIDRVSALASDPDSDDITSLMGRLRVH